MRPTPDNDLGRKKAFHEWVGLGVVSSTTWATRVDVNPGAECRETSVNLTQPGLWVCITWSTTWGWGCCLFLRMMHTTLGLLFRQHCDDDYSTDWVTLTTMTLQLQCIYRPRRLTILQSKTWHWPTLTFSPDQNQNINLLLDIKDLPLRIKSSFCWPPHPFLEYRLVLS